METKVAEQPFGIIKIQQDLNQHNQEMEKILTELSSSLNRIKMRPEVNEKSNGTRPEEPDPSFFGLMADQLSYANRNRMLAADILKHVNTF